MDLILNVLPWPFNPSSGSLPDKLGDWLVITPPGLIELTPVLSLVVGNCSIPKFTADTALVPTDTCI